jgi:hypothetical protein
VSIRRPALRLAAVSRRAILSLLSVAVLAQPLVAMGAPGIAVAASESATPFSDQGSNANYRSYITSVTPNVHGLSVQVLEFADRLVLINHTGETVTIYGYQNDPYARVLANGTAERNARSPATYLNESFYGNITVPAIANPDAPPKWEVIDRTGQFEWHDHRIHWPSPLLPPQVKDKSKRTLIFDWTVPIAVGARKGAIAGQLFWTPDESKAPVAVIVLGVVIVLAGLAFVVFVRRRRARASRDGGDGGSAAATKEAW